MYLVATRKYLLEGWMGDGGGWWNTSLKKLQTSYHFKLNIILIILAI